MIFQIGFQTSFLEHKLAPQSPKKRFILHTEQIISLRNKRLTQALRALKTGLALDLDAFIKY